MTAEPFKDDYVSQQAEKYNVKGAEWNLSAESLDHSRYMICTNRKTTFVDLPPTSAALQGHLLQAYYFTNISLKVFDITKSTWQPLNFWLSEMLKKFIIKCACKKAVGIVVLIIVVLILLLITKGTFYRLNVIFWTHFHCFSSILQSIFRKKKVPTSEFRRNDLNDAKLGFVQMCITKEFRKKNWSSFGQSIEVRNNCFCYMFTSEFQLTFSTQIRLITKDWNLNSQT